MPLRPLVGAPRGVAPTSSSPVTLTSDMEANEGPAVIEQRATGRSGKRIRARAKKGGWPGNVGDDGAAIDFRRQACTKADQMDAFSQQRPRCSDWRRHQWQGGGPIELKNGEIRFNRVHVCLGPGDDSTAAIHIIGRERC